MTGGEGWARQQLIVRGGRATLLGLGASGGSRAWASWERQPTGGIWRLPDPQPGGVWEGAMLMADSDSEPPRGCAPHRPPGS